MGQSKGSVSPDRSTTVPAALFVRQVQISKLPSPPLPAMKPFSAVPSTFGRMVRILSRSLTARSPATRPSPMAVLSTLPALRSRRPLPTPRSPRTRPASRAVLFSLLALVKRRSRTPRSVKMLQAPSAVPSTQRTPRLSRRTSISKGIRPSVMTDMAVLCS